MICKKRNCGSTKFKYEPTTFKNGTKHFIRRCAKCGAHNYYASELEAKKGEPLNRKKKDRKLVTIKEKKESRILWNQFMTRLFKVGGQDLVDNYVQEMQEMVEYEEKISTDENNYSI